MSTTPPQAIQLREPRHCRFLFVPPPRKPSLVRFHIPISFPRLSDRARRAGGLWRLAWRTALSLPARRRVRHQTRVLEAVRAVLNGARSSDERRAFRVCAVRELTQVDGDVYEVRAVFLSKRSSGRTERLFLVRLRGIRWRRLFGQLPTPIVLGWRTGEALRSLGRIAKDARAMVGPATLMELGGPPCKGKQS